MKLLGHAIFSQLSNDLFWSFYDKTGGSIRWSGYDDWYWWNKVAPTDLFQIREHQGKRYRLNPSTGEVFLHP
jgi:hypothetical protein